MSREKIKMAIIGERQKMCVAPETPPPLHVPPPFSIRGSPFHRPLIIDYLEPIRAHC